MPEPQTQRLITAEEFEAFAGNGERLELVAGKVVEMAPVSHEHGRHVLRVARLLGNWVEQHRLGEVVVGEPGYVLSRNPDHVRAPDGAFFRTERMPPSPAEGFIETVPDLVIEVASANDRPGEVLEKVGEWLSAGAQVVWLVWPGQRRTAVYGPGEHLGLLGPGDTLTCEPLLPGLALEVDRIFGSG